jgi:hypothetical protein
MSDVAAANVADVARWSRSLAIGTGIHSRLAVNETLHRRLLGTKSRSAQFFIRTQMGDAMDKQFDRRKFLKVSGTSLGVGVLISVAPAMAGGGPAATVRRWFRRQNGEEVTPFNLVQLSDAHVGFSGPPNPTGTKAFEHAIDVVNGL